MTAPTSRLAYLDAFEAWEKADADPRGIRLRFTTKENAQTFRSRLHNARSIDRSDNTVIYREDVDNPLYGRSVYDPFVVRLKEDEEGMWWIYIERSSIDRLVVESLSEMEQ
jgi:hypothetical protein